MYQTSPTTGLAGADVCAYLRRPPAVILPVIATSPPMVAAPTTPKLANWLMLLFSMINPPMLADVVLRLPAVTVSPAVLKNPSLMVVVRAVRYAVTLAFEYVPSLPTKILTPLA